MLHRSRIAPRRPIHALIFRPMFNTVDMLTSTVAAILMWNGHWLTSLPVVAISAWSYAYGRRGDSNARQ